MVADGLMGVVDGLDGGQKQKECKMIRRLGRVGSGEVLTDFLMGPRMKAFLPRLSFTGRNI